MSFIHEVKVRHYIIYSYPMKQLLIGNMRINTKNHILTTIRVIMSENIIKIYFVAHLFELFLSVNISYYIIIKIYLNLMIECKTNYYIYLSIIFRIFNIHFKFQ